jgi:hypothetical protein
MTAREDKPGPINLIPGRSITRSMAVDLALDLIVQDGHSFPPFLTLPAFHPRQ